MIALLRAVVVAVSILSGECGDIGHGCEVMVARTMANRMAARMPVLEAYYGRGPVTARSLAAAIMLVTHPDALADRRYYYAYSDADIARMGWREGDAQLCGNGMCLHLARGWPGS